MYGTGLAAISLANLEIWKSRILAQTFIAPKSIGLLSVMPYLKTGPGYSSGTGGRILVTLRDGQAPLHALAAATLSPGNPVEQNFPAIYLAAPNAPPQLVAGRSYAIWYENLDADPTSNYVSLNSLQNDATTDYQPFDGYHQFAVLENEGLNGSVWTKQTKTPIFMLRFTDGTTHGQGYLDVRAQSARVLTSSAIKVREVFTPRMDIYFNKCVMYLSGQWRTVSGYSSDGRMISSPLKAGVNYALQVPDGEVVYPIMKGDHQLNANANVFQDGNWQGSIDGGKTYANLLGGDLSFYFQ